jgi:hypothetical protein
MGLAWGGTTWLGKFLGGIPQLLIRNNPVSNGINRFKQILKNII